MAQLLCKTTDFDSIQSLPMLLQSKKNPRLKCREAPELNYFHWKDHNYCDAHCLAQKRNVTKVAKEKEEEKDPVRLT